MDNGQLVNQFQKLVKQLFGGKVRVIIARDRTATYRVNGGDVKLWDSPEKTKVIKSLEQDRTYYFELVGTQVNMAGVVMMCVRFGKRFLWVNPLYLDWIQDTEEEENGG